MKFKEWFLKEMTSTANIAAFKRICIPMVRRKWPPSIATMFDQDPPGEKKKIKMQPQVQEIAWSGSSDLWNNQGMGDMKSHRKALNMKPPTPSSISPPEESEEQNGYPLEVNPQFVAAIKKWCQGGYDPLRSVLARSFGKRTVYLNPEELERLMGVAHEVEDGIISSTPDEIRVATELIHKLNPEL